MPIIDNFLKEMNIVNEKEFQIIDYDVERGLITCKVGHTIYSNVTPRRPFPITNPNFVLLINDSNKVVATIVNVENLNPRDRDILLTVLNNIYFIPKIIKIYSMNTSGDEFVWDIETDRGRTTVRTRGRSSIVKFGSRVVIIDVNDVIYEIPSINSLDRRSKKIIESLI